MKRNILFILVLLNCIVLGLIILKSIENKEIETFQSPSASMPSSSASTPSSSASTPSSSASTPSSSASMPSSSASMPSSSASADSSNERTIELEESPGRFITLTNVKDLNFKRREKPTNNTCEKSSDCKTEKGFECEQNENIMLCLHQTPIPMFRLHSEKKSEIVHKIAPSEIMNHNIEFSFVLTNRNDTKKHIISCDSGLWTIYSQKNNLYIDTFVYTKTKNDLFTKDQNTTKTIKINESPLISYSPHVLNITNFINRITIIFDWSSPITVDMNMPNCFSDTDCPFGELSKCIEGQSRQECSVHKDIYHIGSYSETKSNTHYSDLFIGKNIKIINKKTSCNFYGTSPKLLKNKRMCLEECAKSNCTAEECKETMCKKVPECEFVPTGRHSIDCLQHCIRNNDCPAKFCKEQCESDDVPWSKDPNRNESFNSQYFDREGKPSPVIISLNTISTDGTKAIISWGESFPGKLPIKGYISYLYKTFNKTEAVKINKINLNNCAERCEYVLKELVPDETYTFGIKAFNDIGMGHLSNLITFKATVSNLNFDINIEDDLEVNANDIGDFHMCTE